MIHCCDSVVGNLLGPSLISDWVHIGTVVLVTIGIHFPVFAKESALVERIFVGHVACLGYLVKLCVEQVWWSRRVAVFLSSENEDLSLGDRTSTKPVLDIILEALWPHFYQLPVWLLVVWVCIKSLDVCHGRFVAAQHIDKAVLDCYCSWEVPVPVQLRLLPPLVARNGVYFACLRCIVKARTDSVYEVWPNCGKAVAFSWVKHVW